LVRNSDLPLAERFAAAQAAQNNRATSLYALTGLKIRQL
jgi:hypothetical protein